MSTDFQTQLLSGVDEHGSPPTSALLLGRPPLYFHSGTFPRGTPTWASPTRSFHKQGAGWLSGSVHSSPPPPGEAIT